VAAHGDGCRGTPARASAAYCIIWALLHRSRNHSAQEVRRAFHDIHRHAHRRIVEWFGHYLKDEPAPAWLTSGVSYLQREQELKALKARTPR